MRDYGNAYITYHLVLSDVLPKKGFPVVFHGVKGSEQHAKWSPSNFNIVEASVVRDYCVRLTGDSERKICEWSIFKFYHHFFWFTSVQIQRISALSHLTKLNPGPLGSY
jgi:hypothetical protein